MNPIGWCDCTINPISGCLNICPYCYARRMAKRLAGRFGYPADDPFRPTFHPDKLQDIYNLHGAGKRVFLDSMGDWFSPGVDPAWIRATIDAVRSKPEHTFLVLTKRPDQTAALRKLDIPSNLWFGVTVDRQYSAWRIEEMLYKSYISRGGGNFVSFEPLHGPISCNLKHVDWVIIGAESGNRKDKISTKSEWAKQLTEQAREKGIPVFHKDNLIKSLNLPSEFILKEFPGEMRQC